MQDTEKAPTPQESARILSFLDDLNVRAMEIRKRIAVIEDKLIGTIAPIREITEEKIVPCFVSSVNVKLDETFRYLEAIENSLTQIEKF